MITVVEQFYKPFTVAGEIVSEGQIRGVQEVLRRPAFRFFDVGKAMIGAGVSYENHDRAADRLLQRARKLGLVVASGPMWRTQAHGWHLIDRAAP